MKRTVDTAKLCVLLMRHDHGLRDLSRMLGVSLRMLIDKINGRNNQDFLFDEMDLIKEHYSLSTEEAIVLFFP